MARPVAANSEITRRLVLDVSAQLFSQRGVDGVSIRDIAQKANLSSGMVYHYFGSKVGLYNACIDAMYAELRALKAELQGTAVSLEPAQTVDSAVRATFKFARLHQAAIRLLMRDVIDCGEMPEERQQKYLVPFLTDSSLLLAAFTGCSVNEMRLFVQSMSHLTVRYALTTTSELALICNTPLELAEQHIEDHLVQVAFKMLNLDYQETS